MAGDSSSSFVPDLPIFTGKGHFGDWQLQLKTFFMSQGLWPINSNRKSFQDKLKERRKDAHALYCIQRALSPTIFRKINNPKLSAKQAWDILDKKYTFHQPDFIAGEDFHAIKIPETIGQETPEIIGEETPEIIGEEIPLLCDRNKVISNEIPQAIEEAADSSLPHEVIPNEIQDQGINKEEMSLSLPRDCIKVISNETRELNPAAYTPKVISIGPLHHGIPNLLSMQKLKLEYAKSFLKRTQIRIAEFVHFIQKNEESIRDCYFESKSELDSRAYVEMILLDSFFILEFFIRYAIHSISLSDSYLLSNQDYQIALRDSLWVDRGLLKKIMEDLLMFENQLPFLLLSKLLDLSGQRVDLRKYYLIISRLDCPNTEYFHLNDIMRHIFNNTEHIHLNDIMGNIIKNTQYLHLNDIIRHILATKRSGQNQNGSAAKWSPRRYGGPCCVLPILALVKWKNLIVKSERVPVKNSQDTPHLKNAAKKLSQSRVKFKWVQTPGLSEICFEKRTLHLPRLVVDNTTERYFRNLIVLNVQSQFNHDAFICSYLWLLHLLMQSDDDVAVLVEANVIINELDNKQAVVGLFTKLCRNVTVNEFHFSDICKDLDNYCSSCKGWWNNRVRILKNGYFTNLWTSTATIAAIILLVLTLIQTITSILQVLGILLEWVQRLGIPEAITNSGLVDKSVHHDCYVNRNAQHKFKEKRKDAHALYCIQRALAPTIFTKINNHSLSAKHAWDILDADYNFHHLNFLADEDFHTIEIPQVFEEEISLPVGCIKVIPKEIRELNPAANTPPRVISIGPLHHGRPHLGRMEKIKLEYAKRFLEYTKKPKAFFVHFLQKHEESIRLFYSEPSDLDSRAYVEMILLDSFFILELIIRYDDLPFRIDPLYADPGLMRSIQLDLLMFENQLPYLLLSKLFAFSGQNDDLKNYCTFFFDEVLIGIGIYHINEQFHLTDFIWRIITTEFSAPGYFLVTPHLKYAAKKLSDSRVKFQSIKSPSLSEIRFKKRSLRLLRLVVDNTTERLFSNLMEMEQSQFKDDAYICSYIRFLHLLMQSEDDVAVLVEAKVIINQPDNNQAVVELFKNLCSNITVTYFHFYYICKDLDDYCSSWEGRLNNRVRILKDVYFSNMWTGTGTIAAIILLVLTLIQTITSILQVLQV
ncbi:hypothetical protein ACFE04_009610 [Oxalis oulophora]